MGWFFEIFVTFSKYLNFIFKTRLKVVEPKNLHLMGDTSVLAEFNLKSSFLIELYTSQINQARKGNRTKARDWDFIDFRI